MSKIVTFGEIMMRLNPPGYNRILQTNSFDISFAGGEASVSVSLANYGEDTCFVTKLPDHEVGQACLNSLRKYGVNTDFILRGGPRLGVYYYEKGASQRPSKVIYDRAGSSIALAKKNEFDWDKIFKGAKWFHFTGITPALGGELPEICLQACKKAKEKGLTVSCDLNYRKKLWTTDEAKKCMSKLMPYVDVCIANEEDAKDVFGIEAENTDIESGKLNHEGYVSVARKIAKKFGCKKVAITLRGSISASINEWAGMLYDAKQDKACFSKNYTIQLVDRLGGGDSFGGGLIYSLVNKYTDRKAIEFAVAASCLKQCTECDFNLSSIKEVESLAGGNASGRVQR